MAHRLHFTHRARQDLLDIWRYVAQASQAAADRLYDRFDDRIRILKTFPEAGAARPDVAPDARVLVERPYLILYRARVEGVPIVRFVHGARDIDGALFGEGVE